MPNPEYERERERKVKNRKRGKVDHDNNLPYGSDEDLCYNTWWLIVIQILLVSSRKIRHLSPLVNKPILFIGQLLGFAYH